MLRRTRKHILSYDYLWPALFLSLLAHGLFFWFIAPSLKTTTSPSLTTMTTVINYQTAQTPQLAQRLAQWDATGGGDTTRNTIATSPWQSTGSLSVNELFLQAMMRKQEELQAQRDALLDSLVAQPTQIPNPQKQEHAPLTEEGTKQGQDALNITQRRLAALSLDIERHQQGPRYLFTGPSTMASPFAAYIEAWQAKIEHIGTEHYPEQARGQSSATLQVTVYIDRNGEINGIEFDQPAQDPLFNLAAQRIIHLAAPFAPFSPEMSQQTDILAITRTWHFEQGQLQTKQ